MSKNQILIGKDKNFKLQREMIRIDKDKYKVHYITPSVTSVRGRME